MQKHRASKGAKRAKRAKWKAPISRRPPVKINSLLIKRLTDLMQQHDLTGSRLAGRAGLGNTAVYDILYGKSKHPTSAVLSNIAKVLEVDVAYLLGTSDDPQIQMDTAPSLIRLLFAETGVWASMKKTPGTLLPIKHVSGPRHPRYPGAPHFALQMADASMEIAEPYPMPPGATIFCVDLGAVGARVQSGKIYAVRIVDNEHQRAQTLIRRVVMHGAGRFELLSESKSRKKYPVLTFKGRLTSDPTSAVCAFGLPYMINYTFDT